jgi:acetoin utilization protein AcuB
MLLAKDAMTKMPFHLTSQDTILEASRLMAEKNIRHLPIVDEGKLVGMLSDRDVYSAMHTESDQHYYLTFGFSKDQKICDYMNWPVYVVGEEDKIVKVVEEILQQKVSALLVENHSGELTGIITSLDLLKCYFYELQNQSDKNTYRADDHFPTI